MSIGFVYREESKKRKRDRDNTNSIWKGICERRRCSSNILAVQFLLLPQPVSYVSQNDALFTVAHMVYILLLFPERKEIYSKVTAGWLTGRQNTFFSFLAVTQSKSPVVPFFAYEVSVWFANRESNIKYIVLIMFVKATYGAHVRTMYCHKWDSGKIS